MLHQQFLNFAYHISTLISISMPIYPLYRAIRFKDFKLCRGPYIFMNALFNIA